MATAWLSFYLGIFIILTKTCLMNCTQSTNCYRKFTPYDCQFLPQSDEIFPCKVYNTVGCQGYKEQVPPKDLKLNTAHLEFINIYDIEYQNEPYDGETHPALNFTIALSNVDLLQSCRALRVNIWNNGTRGNYGGEGICRLFDFNISSTLWRKRKKNQPAYINYKCFTATVDEHYFLKFTTLPYVTEIIYSIIIKSYFTPPAILAVAPMHRRLAISIVLGVSASNICKNRFILIISKMKIIKFSTNNSFVFENLQPGLYMVRVESDCLVSGHYIESGNIWLKNISEPKSLFKGNIIWIFLSLVPTFILIICLYEYFLWKQKCIDRSHKCVIDLLYAGNLKTVADHLKKLMEEEFEWSVNNVQIDRSMTCKCEMPTNDVALYLTAPDMHGKVMFPNHYKILQDSHTSENVIKALLFYTYKNSNQISVDFTPSFHIVKDIKRLFYFVYKATKSYSQAELFHETHYPNVNYIEKLKSWKRFVDFIENIGEDVCSISTQLTLYYD